MQQVYMYIVHGVLVPSHKIHGLMIIVVTVSHYLPDPFSTLSQHSGNSLAGLWVLCTWPMPRHNPQSCDVISIIYSVLCVN